MEETSTLRVSLVDPATDQILRILGNNDTIDPDELSSGDYALVAELSDGTTAGSVLFLAPDGTVLQTENFAPYTRFDLSDGDYAGEALPSEVGIDFTIAAYSGRNGQGEVIASEVFSINVASSQEPDITPPDYEVLPIEDVADLNSPVSVSVVYTDDQAIDISTIGTEDVHLYKMPVEGPTSIRPNEVSVTTQSDGSVTATYLFSPPAAGWDFGLYGFNVFRNSISDVQGNLNDRNPPTFFSLNDDAAANAEISISDSVSIDRVGDSEVSVIEFTLTSSIPISGAVMAYLSLDGPDSSMPFRLLAVFDEGGQVTLTPFLELADFNLDGEVTLRLLNVEGANVELDDAGNAVSGVVVDGGIEAFLTIEDAGTVVENGDSGTTALVFDISTAPAVEGPVTLDYELEVNGASEVVTTTVLLEGDGRAELTVEFANDNAVEDRDVSIRLMEARQVDEGPAVIVDWRDRRDTAFGYVIDDDVVVEDTEAPTVTFPYRHCQTNRT